MNLRNESSAGRVFTGAVFTGDAQYCGCDFTGARFVDCEFIGAVFSGCDFTGARFVDCEFTSAVFTKCVLRDAVLERIRRALSFELDDCDAAGALIKDCDFRGAYVVWQGCSFNSATFESVVTSESTAHACDFRGVSATDLRVFNGNFYKCDFTGAPPRSTSLARASSESTSPS